MGIKHKTAMTVPAGLAVGALVSVVTTIGVCMIGAWLIGAEILAQEQIGYCSIVALLLSTILGGITTWKKVRRKRLLVCVGSGAVYYAILVMVTVVFFDGRFEGLGVTLCVILIGSLTTYLLSKVGQKPAIGKKTGKIHR